MKFRRSKKTDCTRGAENGKMDKKIFQKNCLPLDSFGLRNTQNLYYFPIVGQLFMKMVRQCCYQQSDEWTVVCQTIQLSNCTVTNCPMVKQYCVKLANSWTLLCPTVKWLVTTVFNCPMVCQCFVQLSNGQLAGQCSVKLSMVGQRCVQLSSCRSRSVLWNTRYFWLIYLKSTGQRRHLLRNAFYNFFEFTITTKNQPACSLL